MADEEVLAGTPAPEPEFTATPESTNEVPESQKSESNDSTKDEQPEKVFTQAELDDLIGKRLARERRKWLREQGGGQQQTPKPPGQMPQPDQFQTTEEYVEAAAEYRAQQLVQERETRQKLTELSSKYQERVEAALDKYPDFEAVALAPNLPITDAMALVIQASDIGPEIAYHLGTHPEEAGRIARLDPLRQAAELGKLEDRLAKEPPVKRVTSAPAPLSPTKARAVTTVLDPTDPKASAKMTDSEWIAAERKRQLRKAHGK